MNPQGADLLSQLRDIHAPPAAPWWPPAPGWWILAALLLAVLVVGARVAWRAWRRRQRQQRSLLWVEQAERDLDPAAAPQAFLAAINRVFKLVAMAAFPGQPVARLQGEDWVRFLQERMKDAEGTEQLEAFGAGPYQPAPRFDAEVVGQLAREWISRHG